MARRAYATEDKDARRQVILKAAGDLFVAGDGELPSVAQIAAAAGLAKGTVYLYFRTKGAIFASILQDGWGEVIAELERTFQPADGAEALMPPLISLQRRRWSEISRRLGLACLTNGA